MQQFHNIKFPRSFPWKAIFPSATPICPSLIAHGPQRPPRLSGNVFPMWLCMTIAKVPRPPLPRWWMQPHSGKLGNHVGRTPPYSDSTSAEGFSARGLVECRWRAQNQTHRVAHVAYREKDSLWCVSTVHFSFVDAWFQVWSWFGRTSRKDRNGKERHQLHSACDYAASVFLNSSHPR